MDIAAGAELAAVEMSRDWYRDPWGWPEITDTDWAGRDAGETLGLRREDGGYRLPHPPYFHPIDVPKGRRGMRPAVVQDPLSRLAYLSAARAASDTLHRDLPVWVYGWRSRGTGLAQGGTEWSNYVASFPRGDLGGSSSLRTDIASFFPSTTLAHVDPLVRGRLDATTANVIADVVAAHHSLEGRSGLPQRSFASEILAHAVLRPVDEVLDAALDEGRIEAARRWLDDISAEGTEDELPRVRRELQVRARHEGFELNDSKTRVGPVSGARFGLRRLDDVGRTDRLAGLELAVIERPTGFPKAVVQGVLLALTKRGLFDRHAEWCGVAVDLPHVADDLSRYLRAAAEADPSRWAALGLWFAAQSAGVPGLPDWTVAQLSLIFPAEDLPAPVWTVVRAWLEKSVNLQQFSIAVHRAGTVDPTSCRRMLRARADATGDPLMLRTVALGLLMTGEDPRSVRDIVERDPRNSLLLRWLRNHEWTAPDAARDFT